MNLILEQYGNQLLQLASNAGTQQHQVQPEPGTRTGDANAADAETCMTTSTTTSGVPVLVLGMANGRHGISCNSEWILIHTSE